jgi:hypothetical protein
VKKELLAIHPENYTGVSCFETESGNR